MSSTVGYHVTLNWPVAAELSHLSQNRPLAILQHTLSSFLNISLFGKYEQQFLNHHHQSKDSANPQAFDNNCLCKLAPCQHGSNFLYFLLIKYIIIFSISSLGRSTQSQIVHICDCIPNERCPQWIYLFIFSWQCSRTCGDGFRERTVSCVSRNPNGDDRQKAESDCGHLVKPKTRVPCMEGRCPLNVQWFISAWGSVSVPGFFIPDWLHES